MGVVVGDKGTTEDTRYKECPECVIFYHIHGEFCHLN